MSSQPFNVQSTTVHVPIYTILLKPYSAYTIAINKVQTIMIIYCMEYYSGQTLLYTHLNGTILESNIYLCVLTHEIMLEFYV